MTSQQKHIYKYVQSQISILQQRVSATPVTTIRVSYNKNTITINEWYKNKTSCCYIWLSVALPVVIKYKIVLSLKISQDVLVLYLYLLSVRQIHTRQIPKGY